MSCKAKESFQGLPNVPGVNVGLVIRLQQLLSWVQRQKNVKIDQTTERERETEIVLVDIKVSRLSTKMN